MKTSKSKFQIDMYYNVIIKINQKEKKQIFLFYFYY